MGSVMHRHTGSGVAITEIRRRYADLIDTMLRTGRTDLARETAQLAVDQQIWADPLQRPIEYASFGSHRPIYQPHEFWFVNHLESHYPQIQAEMDALTRRGGIGVSAVEAPLLDAGRWEEVVLYEAGRRQENACARFPVTTSIIEQIPEATTFSPGVVTLSWLEPGAHVIPHCGRSNEQLRVHLGLRVPRGATIRVGDQFQTWQDGRCIVFDDSYEHEVWQRGDSPRLVLLMDVLYPGLDQAQRSHVLGRRTSISEQIAACLAQRDLHRIETDDRGIVMRPAPSTSALVRRYLDETHAQAVELHNGSLRLELASTD